MVKAKEVAIDSTTKKNIDLWLNGKYDLQTKEETRTLLRDDPQQAIDAFYRTLSFGTGGLRGVMGPGTNRMNIYTVRSATQGLANYLIKTDPQKKHSVIIGYDSRHRSALFSQEAARVLAGNGIQVYLFKELRPTPLVSFGCREKHCSAAIVVTASHNPPEYNGYKVYWNDGAQVLPPHDQGIIDESQKITDNASIRLSAPDHPLIVWIDREIDTAYLKAIDSLQHYPKDNKTKGSSLKIVYTNLHGTGITLVPPALRQWGFNSTHPVPEQEKPDGDFPTVKSPNPEDGEALLLGIRQMLATKGDLLIATDPDTDRMGVVVNDHGNAVILNGNQIAVLSLYHICKALSEQKRLPEKAVFVKTIVTTELFKTIAEKGYKKSCVDVLPGFKYIAEKIREWEGIPNGPQFIYGGEESYGTLLGTHARDKDAVIASCLIAEAALQAKLHGKTLMDTLEEIYRKFGFFHEKLLSVKYEESKEGHEKMSRAMARLRQAPPSHLGGIAVRSFEDYENSVKKDLVSQKTEKISLPKSNILLFWLQDGSKLVIRPSGTEPKIKIYCGLNTQTFQTLQSAQQQLEKKADTHLSSLKGLL